MKDILGILLATGVVLVFLGVLPVLILGVSALLMGAVIYYSYKEIKRNKLNDRYK